MSLKDLLPEGWHREWVLRLEKARAQGNLEACLELRREDAKHSGLSDKTLKLALAEERDWHAKHVPRYSFTNDFIEWTWDRGWTSSA